MHQTEAETRSRARSKPLRTYAKRSATDSRNESLSKRRRAQAGDSELGKEDDKEGSPSETRTETTSIAHRSTPDASTAQGKPEVKRGSIMNFFKPIPQPSSTVSSPQAEEAEDQSTPPSSPPSTRAEPKRKPRILKFRGNSLPISESEDATHDAETPTMTNKDEGPKDEGRRTRSGGSKPTNNETIQTEKTKKPKNKTSTVQTTLNISSQAAFSECKICNTVWNPLYPDDVKYHKKQHAAVLREKKKSEGNDL